MKHAESLKTSPVMTLIVSEMQGKPSAFHYRNSDIFIQRSAAFSCIRLGFLVHVKGVQEDEEGENWERRRDDLGMEVMEEGQQYRMKRRERDDQSR